MSIAATLAPQHGAALLLLDKLLQQRLGFRLLFAQHNDPAYRDRLLAHLLERTRGGERLDLQSLSCFSAFEDHLAQQVGQVAALHVINLESLRAQRRAEFLRGLNYHREQLAAKARWSTVFWLTEASLGELARQAPDFWAWREQVLDFSLPRKAPIRQEKFLGEIVNRDSPLKQQRIAELEAYFAGRTGGETLAEVDMLAELGRLYWSVGDYAQARVRLEAAIAGYDTLGEVLAQATASADLASILATTGETTQALQRLRTRCLPVFERLGDVRSRALTLGKIADILHARGELEEALQLHDANLPIAKRLGDIEMLASIRHARAAIRWRRGDRQDDGLPAIRDDLQPSFAFFRKLGRPDAIAVVGHLYAQVLAADGEQAQALAVLDDVEAAWRKLDNAPGLAQAQALRRTIAAQPASDDRSDPR